MNENRYLTRAGDGNVLFIITTGYVHVPSWVLFLVTISILDLVMIHWIQWKSFRENSIALISYQLLNHFGGWLSELVLIQWSWTSNLQQMNQ